MILKMRLKKAFVLFGSFIFILIVFMLYLNKDLTTFPNRKSTINEDFEDNKWLHFEDRIRKLENGLNKHHEAVNEMRIAMKSFLTPVTNTSFDKQVHYLANPKLPPSEIVYEGNCPFQVGFVPRTDIQMLDIYKSLKFDNIDGGVWKQGWRIEVDDKDWNRNNKLKVFVIPHSHNDPGWIKTFEDYYLSQTKHILNNMLSKLPEDPRRKFIWAEISYFAMWWEELNDDERELVRRLVKRNQLEIVSGGWVMNDEANSHWVSTVLQYTEGHQWLQHNLNYTPQSSWSIDPFGMSATQAVLLKEMGFGGMLIQRVHYSVKKHLASQRQLEFKWRQTWDGSGKTNMFTHMMPFYSYDIPHTCGPDPKVCCQFDFKRLPGHGVHCPWKIAPQPITDKNVVQRAALLLDQYRKKSKLYKTNVLLVPLGDDFRYDHVTEWEVQYQNYQKLFDYMNGNLNLNVKIQFGTLTDYFDAVSKEMSESHFPSLSGDFFTYADRDDHYWSGYYTSRPFYKRMDRILLSYIKSAETILTLAHMKSPDFIWLTDKEAGLQKTLSEARKSLALFQHHDGITGTAKDLVVKDYAKRMLTAISGCQKVIQQSAHILLSGPEVEIAKQDTTYYNVDDIRHAYNELEEHYQITIGPELRTKRIAIFNSLTFTRIEVVTFYVSTPFLEVLDTNNKKVECQLSPIFEHLSTVSPTKYQLSFVVTIPALSLVSYMVNAVWQHETSTQLKYASVKIFNQYVDEERKTGLPFSNFEIFPSSREFTLQNSRITASFNKMGLLKSLKAGVTTVPVHLDFAKYGVKPAQETSGAYLFMPDGDAVPVQNGEMVVNVVEGPIMSFVVVQMPYVRHTVRIFNTPGADGLGIEIENIVDITKTLNYELVMRLSTNINSTDEFFTDLNGFQILRRKRFTKLPIQANYYPMPTMSYIEDKNIRLTITTASPIGCSSLKPGQLEVMLDRRLKQDDNRGLGQGVLDNVPTRHIFRVLLEKKTHDCQGIPNNHPAGFPSISSHVASQTLLNPLVKLLRTDDEETTSLPSYIHGHSDLGVDLAIPSLRTGVEIKGKDHIGFVVHRQYLDVCFADAVLLKQFPLSHGMITVSTILPSNTYKKLYKTSLSYLLLKKEEDINGDISICPMEVQAFVLREEKTFEYQVKN